MENVEVVVKISKEEYDLIVNDEACGLNVLTRAIAKGKKLPKGHGDLKDIGKCDRKLFYQQCGGADSLITVKTAFDMLLSLPTIIETDKESEVEHD